MVCVRQHETIRQARLNVRHLNSREKKPCLDPVALLSLSDSINTR